MPLPTGGANTPWPPRELDPVHDQLAIWSAWYSGNAETLAATYGHGEGLTFDSTSRERLRNRPSQYRGGLIGTLARWFWGAPTPLGERRAKVHVPLASDIAVKSSKLLFAEPPAFSVEHTPTMERLEELVEDTIHASLLEAGEVSAGLGGVYLRIVWDKEIRPDGPWINGVHADAAIPEWTAGVLRAVTFWRVVGDDGREVHRHLERHEPGVILHGLYKGTATVLGDQIPLTASPATENLVDGDTTETSGLTTTIATGVPTLTVEYVPNMRPAPLWRNVPAGAYLGRADYHGIEPTLDMLDETWTSLMRDIRLAKGRVVVPEYMLQSNGPGKGATWEAEREIYASVNALPDQGQQLTIAQFAIRADEHLRVTQEQTNLAVRGAGYSAQSFGMTGDAAATATEVVARERDSYLTRGHKILYWKPGLRRAVETLLAVDAVHFKSGVEPQKPDIEWPDGVADDPEKTARTLQLLEAARAVSTRTKVEMVNPDWDSEDVEAEVQRIRDEDGAGMPDPVEVGRSVAARGQVPDGEEPDEPQPDGEDEPGG